MISKFSLTRTHGGEYNIARCLGYREGTDCRHLSRCTQKRENWEKWQLCHTCARLLHPEFYKGKRNHGVRKVSPIKPENSIFNLVELIPE